MILCAEFRTSKFDNVRLASLPPHPSPLPLGEGDRSAQLGSDRCIQIAPRLRLPLLGERVGVRAGHVQPTGEDSTCDLLMIRFVAIMSAPLPLQGASVYRASYRGYRFAQPPANIWNPSGVRSCGVSTPHPVSSILPASRIQPSPR